jgi:hypothetical protein
MFLILQTHHEKKLLFSSGKDSIDIDSTGRVPILRANLAEKTNS